MQLTELLALLGPSGVLALGEDVCLRTPDGSETITKAVMQRTDEGSASEIGGGQALIVEPTPHQGDTLIASGEAYEISAVEQHTDGYFRCWFDRPKAS